MSHRVRQKLTKSNDLPAANLFVFYLFNFIVCSLFFFFRAYISYWTVPKGRWPLWWLSTPWSKELWSCGLLFLLLRCCSLWSNGFGFGPTCVCFFLLLLFQRCRCRKFVSPRPLPLLGGFFFCFNKHYLWACDIFLLLRDRLIRLTSGWVSSVVHLPGSQVYLSHDVMAPYLVSPLTFAFALVVSRRQHAKTRISVRHAHCETQRVIMAKQQYTHNR